MDFSKWGCQNSTKKMRKEDAGNNGQNAENKHKNEFSDYLMFSEWLVDIPQKSDFSTDWIMVPCPKGKRSLIVAFNVCLRTIHGKVGLF